MPRPWHGSNSFNGEFCSRTAVLIACRVCECIPNERADNFQISRQGRGIYVVGIIFILKNEMAKQTNTKRSCCIRCGKCCIKSSPTLQVQDLGLITDGTIKKTSLYTLRVGEIVQDPVNKKLAQITKSIIKIKEGNENTACLYFDKKEKDCTIYDNRPSQCASLKCWDTDEFMEIFAGEALGIRDIVSDGVLLGLIDEHGKRCSYSLIEGQVREIEKGGERVVQEILDILRFDYELRSFISEKLNLDLEELDLYFGRPLMDTIIMFGLKVIQGLDGSFLLTRF